MLAHVLLRGRPRRKLIDQAFHFLIESLMLEGIRLVADRRVSRRQILQLGEDFAAVSLARVLIKQDPASSLRVLMPEGGRQLLRKEGRLRRVALPALAIPPCIGSMPSKLLRGRL